MNQTKKKLLPLGSIVYLEEGNQKLHIIGRGITFDDPDTGEQVFTDYMATLYLQGWQNEDVLFFQHDNIDKVVFEGYSDEEEERYMEIYGEWESHQTFLERRLINSLKKSFNAYKGALL